MTSSALPHSSIVAAGLDDYLSDLSATLETEIANLSKSQHFRGIFKNSLAAHAVLEVLRKHDLPLLGSASGIARRIPLLIACRQLSLGYVELRRFVEATAWYPYFREHKVEWEEFCRTPGAGVVRDLDSPIRFAAHRDIGWHFAYITERFDHAVVREAVCSLQKSYGLLSGHVHAAIPATTGDLAKPFDKITAPTLRSFQETQREVLSAGCLVVIAARRGSISRLPAVERAWFDWLVSKPRARKIRASTVGA